MKFKTLLTAGLLSIAPVAAFAVPINGIINITGSATTIDLTALAGGAADTVGVDVDFDPEKGSVEGASGVFAPVAQTDDIVDLFDIDFSDAPGDKVWEVDVGGTLFSFEADTYHDFDVSAFGQGFLATGLLKAAGFDDTAAVMKFSTQGADANISFSSTTQVPLPAGILLMGTALAGFGVMQRRKKRQTA